MLPSVPKIQTCNLFKPYIAFKNLLANLKKINAALNVLVDMEINSRLLYPLMKNRILKKNICFHFSWGRYLA